MDEPTEGLAPLIVRHCAEIIRRLKNEGLAILLVEQNAAMALKLVDRVCVISKGRVVHSSTPEALQADEPVKSMYLGI
jgi:branched-chain amino acid transport system ATP-binding protein